MFYSTLLLAAAAFSGVVTAQSTNETGSGPQLDAGTVPIATRQQWCRTQTQTCPRLCGGQTEGGDGNNCDPNTLSFSCICASTGNSPNVSSYEQTLPSLACQEWVIQCTANHPDDAEGQERCQSVECGTKAISEADEADTSSSSSSSSSTASATSSGSGSDASETASSTSESESASQTGESSASETSADADSAASALNLASNYGTGVLAVGILAAFGLAL